MDSAVRYENSHHAKDHCETDAEQWYLVQDSPPSKTQEWLRQNGFKNFMDTFSDFSGIDMLRLSKDDFIEICGMPFGITLHEALRRPLPCVRRLYIKSDGRSCYTAIFLQHYTYDDLVLRLSAIIGCEPESVEQITMEDSIGIDILVTDEVIKYMEDESLFFLDIKGKTSLMDKSFEEPTFNYNPPNDELSSEGIKKPAKLSVKLKCHEKENPL